MVKRFAETLFWLAARLPQGLRVRAGLGLGWFCQRVLRFRGAVVRDNVRQAFPDWPPAEREALIRDIYRHLGLLVFELLSLPRLRPDDVRGLCTVDGREHLDRALSAGRGALVLAAHTGNWELGQAAVAACGYRTCTVVKEIKGELGQYVAERLRTPHGIVPVPRRRAMRLIGEALASGAGVGFVLDQNMTADEGVFVNFFGRPACTMHGLAVLAFRHGVPVVPVHFWREPDNRHHRVRFLPEVPWESCGARLGAAARHNTQRYTTIIEDMIRSHPAQWVWIHRRWRTQPPAADGVETAADREGR